MKCPTTVLAVTIVGLAALSCVSTPSNTTVTIHLAPPAGNALTRDDCTLWVNSVGRVAEENGLEKGVAIIKKEPVGVETSYSGSYQHADASGPMIDVTCSVKDLRVKIRSIQSDKDGALVDEMVEALRLDFNDHDGSLMVDSREDV